MPSLMQHPDIGHLRTWKWRGWSIRYTYKRAAQTSVVHPPILFVHGFGAAIGHWRFNIPALSEHTTVYALDRLGFGASEKAATNYGVPLWAKQIYDFWQTFIRVPVILVGNSQGSLISLTVAATYPEMVAGVVMLNLPDSSVLQATVPQWLRRALVPLTWLVKPIVTLLRSVLTAPPIFRPFFHFIRQPASIRRWAKQAYADPRWVDDTLVEILCRPTYDRGAARALVAMTRSPTELSPAATSTLPQLTIPLLLIWGKRDRFVPASLGPLFQRYNSRLQFVELENAGHCPHDECADTVNQLILDWMNSCN
jgi:pimeloyl-ACP methyl ester carboxylesterase